MENNENKAKGGKGRFVFWLVLFVVFTLTAASCVGIWAYHAVLRHTMNELYEEARVQISQPVKNDKRPSGGTLPNVYLPNDDSQKELLNLNPLARINFDLLKQTSPDVYAWIEIPGTPIAFPIVQHSTNNNYYLRRAISGAYDITGCIYTQNYNSKDFSDKNTIIYGHYMDDGTKFGPLLSYMDKNFYEEHRRIDIYTETEWLTYEVFAAIPYDTRHILKTYNTHNDPYGAFLRDVLTSSDARSIVSANYEIDAESDKIITLSTCLKNSTKRYLVVAKLVKSQLCE